MLQNSDFTDGASSSDDSDNSTGYAQNVVGDTAIPNEIVSAAGDSSHPGAFSDQVLKITGSTGAIKHVFQSIQVNGKKGDVYSFGGWCASDSVPETVQLNTSDSPISYRVFGRKEIKLQFYSNGTFQNEVTAAFAADTTDWQYTCASAVASLDYTEVRIVVCFDYSRNTARFDGLQLHREQFSQSYSYDDNGNVTGYASLYRTGTQTDLLINNDKRNFLHRPARQQNLIHLRQQAQPAYVHHPRRCENNQCLRCKRQCYRDKTRRKHNLHPNSDGIRLRFRSCSSSYRCKRKLRYLYIQRQYPTANIGYGCKGQYKHLHLW